MEYVYWIKRKKFTNPYTEGYIGISNNPMKRLANHKRKNDNPHLKRALNLYEDIEVVILHECVTRDEVIKLETHYRPNTDLGWNINSGGATPPRNHLTHAVRTKISNTLKSKNICPYNEKTHSPEAIQKRKDSMVGRKWFYDPATEKSVLSHQQPQGWLIGRKPVTDAIEPKTRGVDYICHVASWKVFDPAGDLYEIRNLKQWCKEKNVPYLRVYQSLHGWKCTKVNDKER